MTVGSDGQQGSTDEVWELDIVRGLTALTGDELPGLEIVLLDAVVDWLFSPANPGVGYDGEHAGRLVSTLFGAIDASRRFQPTQQPEASERIVTARARVVDGAHELAKAGPPGVTLLVSRLMPAVLAELEGHAGDRVKQADGVFCYLLYAVAVGTGSEQHPVVLDGLRAAVVGWDGVLRGGYTLPWRPTRPDGPA